MTLSARNHLAGTIDRKRAVTAVVKATQIMLSK